MLSSKEEEVIALLHAGNETSPIEILVEGFGQTLVISLCKINSTSIILTNIFKCLYNIRIIGSINQSIEILDKVVNDLHA